MAPRLAPSAHPKQSGHRTEGRNTRCTSSYKWAQQVSNLRPLACKARSPGRWMSPGVAGRGADLPRYSLDVAHCRLAQACVGS
jgi:hypothetical protein